MLHIIGPHIHAKKMAFLVQFLKNYQKVSVPTIEKNLTHTHLLASSWEKQVWCILQVKVSYRVQVWEYKRSRNNHWIQLSYIASTYLRKYQRWLGMFRLLFKSNCSCVTSTGILYMFYPISHTGLMSLVLLLSVWKIWTKCHNRWEISYQYYYVWQNQTTLPSMCYLKSDKVHQFRYELVVYAIPRVAKVFPKSTVKQQKT